MTTVDLLQIIIDNAHKNQAGVNVLSGLCHTRPTVLQYGLLTFKRESWTELFAGGGQNL